MHFEMQCEQPEVVVKFNHKNKLMIEYNVNFVIENSQKKVFKDMLNFASEKQLRQK